MPPRLFRKAVSVVILLAVVLSSIALAKVTPREHTQPRAAAAMPFAPSEQLVYEGEFSKLLLRGINIAELRFKAYRPAGPVAGAQAAGDAQPATNPPMLTTDVERKAWSNNLFGINSRNNVEPQVSPT